MCFFPLPFLAKRPLYIKTLHVLQRSKCLKDKREQWYNPPFSQLYRHFSPFKSNYLCHWKPTLFKSFILNSELIQYQKDGVKGQHVTFGAEELGEIRKYWAGSALWSLQQTFQSPAQAALYWAAQGFQNVFTQQTSKMGFSQTMQDMWASLPAQASSPPSSSPFSHPQAFGSPSLCWSLPIPILAGCSTTFPQHLPPIPAGKDQALHHCVCPPAGEVPSKPHISISLGHR